MSGKTKGPSKRRNPSHKAEGVESVRRKLRRTAKKTGWREAEKLAQKKDQLIWFRNHVRQGS